MGKYVHVNENENSSVRGGMVRSGSDWFRLMVCTEVTSCYPGDRGIPLGCVLQFEMYFFIRTYFRTVYFIITNTRIVDSRKHNCSIGKNTKIFVTYWALVHLLSNVFCCMISPAFSILILRTLPPVFFLYGDCTRNHTVKKYNSYGVNFWQKS